MGSYSNSTFGLVHAKVPVLAAMRPGDDVRVWVECDPRLWDVAAVVLRWRRSPTWRKTRSDQTTRIPLIELAELPHIRTSGTRQERW